MGTKVRCVRFSETRAQDHKTKIVDQVAISANQMLEIWDWSTYLVLWSWAQLFQLTFITLDDCFLGCQPILAWNVD
jgi:hypothetical protein